MVSTPGGDLMNYCFVCNLPTGNRWVCSPCLKMLRDIGKGPLEVFMALDCDSRLSPTDPLPPEFTELGIPPRWAVDPELVLPKGI